MWKVKENLSSIRGLGEYVLNLPTKDKLYIIILLGAIIRAPFYFVNFDSRVYQLWTKFLFQTGALAYPDHPPTLFLISGLFNSAFSFLQQINPYIYWWFLFIPLGYIYYRTRDKSPYLLALISFLVLYTGLVGFIGNIYEIGSLISYYAGLALIYISYLFGKRQDENIGLYAALFTAVAWWPVVYSKALLIDSFAAAAISAAYLSYSKIIELESRSVKLFGAVFAVTTLAFYTKYYSLLIAPAIALYALYKLKSVSDVVYSSIPGLLAAILFGVWAYITDFYFLKHYASTHYLFTVFPSPASLFQFFVTALTPFLLILVGYGCYKLYHDVPEELLYLLLPLSIALIFHALQIFVLARSHSLINLTNYLLYTFPMIAVLAAKGWESFTISSKHKYILTVLICLTLMIPVFSSNISLEYGSRYEAPPANNLNTLSKDQLSRVKGYNGETLHYVYSFNRKQMFWSDYKKKEAHFRWLNPKEAKIVATTPVTYRINLKPTGYRPVELSLLKNGNLIENINLTEQRFVILNSSSGVNHFRFESNESIPFISSRRKLSNQR